jgi:hypothetical protein
METTFEELVTKKVGYFRDEKDRIIFEKENKLRNMFSDN